MPMAERRLLLLDREGTVLHAPPDVYVRTWDDVVLAEHAARTIAAAGAKGFVPVLVTNQSCVGRGIVTQDWVDEVNAWLVAQVVASGGPEFLTLSCPHVDADDCDCRKPRTGMLVEAAKRTGLPLASAWYVGDSPVDLAAARAAGVARFFHVCSVADREDCDQGGVTRLPRFADLTAQL
jgi:D-glycero-D-manno-heptose 1,7-bisphosphate phosphatase